MKNLSGKTAIELANIFRADLLADGLDLNPRIAGGTWFDQNVALDYILQFPFCVGERAYGPLEELIQDGELHDVFGFEVDDVHDLVDVVGFLVVGRVQGNRFDDTTFDIDGKIDRCGCDPGSYLIMGFGATYEGAMQKFFARIVEQTAKSIKEAMDLIPKTV